MILPSLLLDLEVDRVDLVDEGANSAAFIKLYKRKEQNDMKFEEILKSMKPEHAEVIKAEIAKAKVEIPEVVATALKKAKEDADKMASDLKLATDAKDAAEQKAAEFEKASCDASGQDSKDKMDEIMKNLDPTVQEVVKSMKAQKEAAEAVVKQMNEQKLNDEAIVKAKDLKALPVEEAKLVAVVKNASPEVYEILKAASVAIETGGTFAEVGKSKGNKDGGDAWTKIEKKAEEYVTADSKLTKQAAITKAIKENPELYREYLNGGAN